jgi:hypothetical protein
MKAQEKYPVAIMSILTRWRSWQFERLWKIREREIENYLIENEMKIRAIGQNTIKVKGK